MHLDWETEKIGPFHKIIIKGRGGKRETGKISKKKTLEEPRKPQRQAIKPEKKVMELSIP